MKKLLLTGSSGFVGHHVVKEFTKHGDFELITFSSSDYNLIDLNETMMLFEKERPDIVLHMAAVCGGILANKNSPADFTHLNLKMGSNIFDAVYHFGVEYLYTLGSVCSYPRNCPVPFKEEDIWNGYPEETNAGYGLAKKMLLVMQQAYRQQYGLKGAHLIPVNVFGPHDHFDLVNSHVIPALIRKFVDAVESNSSVVRCWGTGQASREFIYSKELAEAIYLAVSKSLDYPDPINLGAGQDIKIRDLAHLIAKLCGYRGDIVFTGEVSDGQPKRRLDVSKAERLLGFRATWPFTLGLTETIEWYKKNKDKIKEQNGI